MMNKEDIRVAMFEDSYFPVIDGAVKVVHNCATILNKESYCCVVCPKPGQPFDDSVLPYVVFRTPAVNSSKWQYSVALPGAGKKTDFLGRPYAQGL